MDKAQVYTWMQTQTDITDVVGAKIFSNRTKQGIAPPFMVLTQIEGEHVTHHGGPAGLARSRLQVDCYAETEAVVEALADAVRQLMDTFTGSMGTLDVRDCNLTGERDLYEEPTDASDVGKFRISMDFSIWHTETTP